MVTKYHATKIEIDGHKFDSKLEANIYKRIKELGIKCVLQPRYLLQDKFKFGKRTIREVNYIADFCLYINNESYVIDAKGMETPVFKLKRKLFMRCFDKDIVVIKSVKGFNEWYEQILKKA